MADEELARLAREEPERLREMIMFEIERQDDMPMTRDELLQSQWWVEKAEALLPAEDEPA